MFVTTIIDERHDKHVTSPIDARYGPDRELFETEKRCYTCDSTDDNSYVYTWTRTKVHNVDAWPYGQVGRHISRVHAGRCGQCERYGTVITHDQDILARCIRCDKELAMVYWGEELDHHRIMESSGPDGKRHE